MEEMQSESMLNADEERRSKEGKTKKEMVRMMRRRDGRLGEGLTDVSNRRKAERLTELEIDCLTG